MSVIFHHGIFTSLYIYNQHQFLKHKVRCNICKMNQIRHTNEAFACLRCPSRLNLACYDLNVDGGDSKCADHTAIEANQYSMYVNGVIKSFPSQVSGLRKQANSYKVRHKGVGSEEEGSRTLGWPEGNTGSHPLI